MRMLKTRYGRLLPARMLEEISNKEMYKMGLAAVRQNVGDCCLDSASHS